MCPTRVRTRPNGLEFQRMLLRVLRAMSRINQQKFAMNLRHVLETGSLNFRYTAIVNKV